MGELLHKFSWDGDYGNYDDVEGFATVNYLTNLHKSYGFY
jgi:hypothetical protein